VCLVAVCILLQGYGEAWVMVPGMLIEWLVVCGCSFGLLRQMAFYRSGRKRV
jgi:hypothetical protein